MAHSEINIEWAGGQGLRVSVPSGLASGSRCGDAAVVERDPVGRMSRISHAADLLRPCRVCDDGARLSRRRPRNRGQEGGVDPRGRSRHSRVAGSLRERAPGIPADPHEIQDRCGRDPERSSRSFAGWVRGTRRCSTSSRSGCRCRSSWPSNAPLTAQRPWLVHPGIGHGSRAAPAGGWQGRR